MICGSRAIARARPTRFFMPPLISEGLRCSKSRRPTISSFILTMIPITSAESLVCSLSGRAMLSPTVIELKRAPDWKRMPVFLRSSSIPSSSSRVRSVPSILMLPEVGRIAPISRRSRVDFPQPLPPMMTRISPLLTWKFRSSRTTWSPNFLTRFLTTIGFCSSVFIGLPAKHYPEYRGE